MSYNLDFQALKNLLGQHIRWYHLDRCLLQRVAYNHGEDGRPALKDWNDGFIHDFLSKQFEDYIGIPFHNYPASFWADNPLARSFFEGDRLSPSEQPRKNSFTRGLEVLQGKKLISDLYRDYCLNYQEAFPLWRTPHQDISDGPLHPDYYVSWLGANKDYFKTKISEAFKKRVPYLSLKPEYRVYEGKGTQEQISTFRSRYVFLSKDGVDFSLYENDFYSTQYSEATAIRKGLILPPEAPRKQITLPEIKLALAVAYDLKNPVLQAYFEENLSSLEKEKLRNPTVSDAK